MSTIRKPVNRKPARTPGTKRLWFGVLAAVVLITVPVLPLNPFTAANQNGFNINSIGELILSTLQKVVGPHAPGTRESREKLDYISSSEVSPEDVRPLTYAVEQLEHQIERFPNDPSLHNRIGILYARLGEFTAAKQHFNVAVDQCHQQLLGLKAKEIEFRRSGNASQGDSPVLASSALDVELSAAHGNLARIYDKIGQHEHVVAQLDQLNTDIAFAGHFTAPRAGTFAPGAGQKSTDSSENTSHRITASTAGSLARAQALVQARRLPEAVREYQNMIRLDPEIALAHQQLGLVAVQLNDLRLAISEFESAAGLDPLDANTHNDLGRAYVARGDSGLAEGEFARACSLDPKNMEAAINYANILAANSQYDQAIQTLEKSLSFNAGSAVGHNNLASLLAATGKVKDSVGQYQAALSLKPDMATAHYGLGLALFKLQSYQASIKELKMALTLNPALTDAHDKLEEAYRKNQLAASSVPGID